jgi:hypothetical protein
MALRTRVIGLAAAVLALSLVGAARPEACGYAPSVVLFVNPLVPYDEAAFAGGRLDIVQPTYARWHLAQAYRVLTRGFAQTPRAGERPEYPRESGVRSWLETRARVPNAEALTNLDTSRRGGSYDWFENCANDALLTAAETLEARISTFGLQSAELADWLRAQDRVFQNCGDKAEIVLPEPAPAAAPPLVRADRAYQVAAAHFYATDFTTAERLFETIAADTASPWRPWGRYLAARAVLRRAMLKTDDDRYADVMAEAEAKLRAIAPDGAAGDMRARAERLADYTAARYREVERLHELSRSISTAPEIDWQTMRDYTWLMDALVDPGGPSAYEGIRDRDALLEADDLTDWILSLQSIGDEASRRAVTRWKQSGHVHWLLAAIWRITPDDPDAAAVLRAAADVPRSSPAYLTLAFRRVQLLASAGKRADARRVLSQIDLNDPAVPPTSANLFRAQAFMLAPTFEDLLANAPRAGVLEYRAGYAWPERVASRPDLLDVDGGRVFTTRLPLSLLVKAAQSDTLPDKVRADIAGAAWTRAVLLDRPVDGKAVAPVLARLLPGIKEHLEPYLRAATAADRHYAAVLLLLRFPEMRAYVPASSFGFDVLRHLQPGDPVHSFGSNWWCSFASGFSQEWIPSRTESLVSSEAGRPEFLTTAERDETLRELQRLAALGTAPNYLADEAVKWARARPKDIRAAEALARAVEGTRWGCPDESTGRFSQRAFQTLHKLFPATSWARKTKYWYNGRY